MNKEPHKTKPVRTFKRLTLPFGIMTFFVFLFGMFHTLSTIINVSHSDFLKYYHLKLGFLNTLTMVSFLAAVAAGASWIYRATANKKLIDSRDIDHRTPISAKMAASSVFIPVINLFMPYIALKEIWFSANRTYYNDEAYPCFSLSYGCFFTCLLLL